MDSTLNLHCWMCCHLCLLCDFNSPVCGNCQRDGINYSGYGASESTQLTWLTPGTVNPGLPTAIQSLEPPQESQQLSDRVNQTVASGSSSEWTLSASSNHSMNILQQLPMTPDQRQLLEAAEYCTYLNRIEMLQSQLTFADKTQIYPEMLPIEQMGMNVRLFALPPSHVSQELRRPDYVRFSLIAMALGHSIRRTTNTDRQEAIAKSFWVNRGRVLNLLVDACQAQQNQPNDLFLAGVMNFLLTDVRIFDFVERTRYHSSFALTMLPKRYSMVWVLTFGII